MQHVAELMSDQQRAMIWALCTVRRLTKKAHTLAIPPDFRKLERLTGYVEHFSENLHQPNEERFLSRVAARQPALTSAVRRLRREHAAMKGYGNRLRTALKHWEQGDPKAGPLAAAVAEDYAAFCLRHVRFERYDLMPVALKALSEAEHADAARAFASTADPVAAAQSGLARTIAIEQLN